MINSESSWLTFSVLGTASLLATAAAAPVKATVCASRCSCSRACNSSRKSLLRRCSFLVSHAASIDPSRPNPHFWFSTSKLTGNAGARSSSGLLHAGHGAPGAPQPQALGPSQGRSGCAAQTHRQPSQRLQGCLIWLAIVLAMMVNDTLIIGSGFSFQLNTPAACEP